LRDETAGGKHVHHVFETPLWRSVTKVDLGEQLKPMTRNNCAVYSTKAVRKD